ncbi:MAG: hypothetical protein WAL47_16015 [Pyrinomonadaceae bacterium]
MHKCKRYVVAVVVPVIVKSKVVMSFALVLLFVVAPLAVAAQSQETVRTLEKIPSRNEPVEIEAKVGTKSIRLGQGFMANNDWLSDVSFKVKNISAKPIVRVELELQFPEVPFNNAAFVLPISYGQIPGLADSGPKEQSPVEPNETLEMAVGSDTYGGIKRILTDKGPAFGVTKVRLQISMIIFADGTAWRNGFLLNRDPNKPGRYIRISNNIGRIRTPSVMMGFLASNPKRQFPSITNFTDANFTRTKSFFKPSPLRPTTLLEESQTPCNVRYTGTYYESCGTEYCSTGGQGPGTSCSFTLEDEYDFGPSNAYFGGVHSYYASKTGAHAILLPGILTVRSNVSFHIPQS